MPAVHRAEIAHPLVPDIPFSCVTENVANSNHGNGFIMVFGGVFGSNSESNSGGADIGVR